MSYLKYIVSIVCLTTILLGVCHTKPTKGQPFHLYKKPLNSNFLDILGKRGQRKCEVLLGNDVDLKAFNDEVAYAFLSTGNIRGLDELLRYLIDLQCFTVEETLTFRYTLITIYELINGHPSYPIGETKLNEKRASFNYFGRLNNLIDEFDFAQKNGNNKSFELFQHLARYIMVLEKTNELNNEEANVLLTRINDVINKDDQSEQTLRTV